jgi:hypothetical protein
MTSNTEEQTKTEASASARAPEAPTKANVAPRKPRVARSKPKSGKKATPAKKRAKGPKVANRAKSAGAREGSKTAKVLTSFDNRSAISSHGNLLLREVDYPDGPMPNLGRCWIDQVNDQRRKSQHPHSVLRTFETSATFSGRNIART